MDTIQELYEFCTAPVMLVHGACKTGIDTLANEIRSSRVNVVSMPAQWATHGRRAGPKRNLAMVQMVSAMWECGWDVRFVCAPRGKSPGTRGTIRFARGHAHAVRWDIDVIELQENV
jgi:hypothetical protein